MKFIHLADLHLGKRYNELSLIEDQRYVLEKILSVCEKERPDGVLIAGDVYDKSVPSAEAVELFDWFLNGLAERKISAFIISGNHDSAERLAFGARLMAPSGVYSSPVFGGKVSPIVLNDAFGKVNVYLLPFIKPATVRKFSPDRQIESYTEAVAAAIEEMGVDRADRNVLVAHQFVTGSRGSGSEEFSVGDVGSVDAEAFDRFDYVALGHIHGAQNVGSERVRYCGSPLKYSLSEAKNQKSLTIVELGAKGSLSVREVPLTPLREVVEIRGTYAELSARSFYAGTSLVNDLVHAVLSDEEEVPDAFAKLRIIYKNLMSLSYDNERTRVIASGELPEEGVAATPEELFSALYLRQNGREMTDEQAAIFRELMERAGGDGA